MKYLLFMFILSMSASAQRSFGTNVLRGSDSSKRVFNIIGNIMMVRMMRRPAEFRELIKRFPTSDQATAAKAQLKALGLPYNSAAPARKKTK